MKTYPPGYFTELIREHNWPPRFKSQIVGLISPQTRRYMTEFALGQEARKGGFDSYALGLKGALPYVVQWEARKAREAA